MSNTPARPCTTTALLWQNSLSWICTPSATSLSMVAPSACGLQPGLPSAQVPGEGDMAVDRAQPAVGYEVVDERVGPIPPPGEPALELALWRDHRGAHGRDDEAGERLARVRLDVDRADLIPTGQLARVGVPLAGGHHERAGDDRAAALERCAQRPE